MKKNLNYVRFLLAFIAIPFFTTSCSDKADEQSVVFTPSITSLSPNAGIEETEVTIVGKNFGSNKNAVNVTFGSRAAVIAKLSDSEVKVRVPERSDNTVVSVPVAVAVNEKISNTKTFTYNDIPPSIISVTPTCFYGSTVVIQGDNFSPDKDNNMVKFGTVVGTVTSATKTSLTVITPDLGSATTADITVTKSDIVSNSRSIAVDVDQNKIATYNWTTHAVKPGVIYKTGEFNLFGETLRRIYIVDVTLDAANTLGIGFSATKTNTVTMCNSYDAVAGVNAGFFPFLGSADKDPYIRINGTKVQDGHTDISQLYTNSALLIHNNVATVRKFTQSGRDLNLVAAAIPVAEAENIIVCGPMLITSGVIEDLDMSTGHNSSATGRTGFGVTADGKRVFMVVVDTGGGTVNTVKGVSTLQLAKILQALGAVNAMNLDGGGSSTMFVKDQGAGGRVNYPLGGTWQRPVKSVIYVK